MYNKKIQIKPALSKGIQDLCENNTEVHVISLCTADGFSIQSFVAQGQETESDKLAALSSTISALSNSSAKQVLQEQFDITIIEANSGNMLFVRTSYLGSPCVLTVVANAKMALATARYKTKKLADLISAI